MSLTNYKIAFDNAYEEIFQKALVAKKIANTRFQANLKYGASVERFSYDISGVQVRTVTRGSASTIDTVTDSNELLTINLEKEAVFHISDGEVTQTGPLNPGEVIGGQVAIKVALDLDGRVFSEVTNAFQTFDNGDLTTLASTGTAITLSSTTVPQMVSRMPAKLRRGANQDIMNNMVLVIDSYGASDVAQYLLGKNFDIAAAVFKNGYTGDISNAQVYVSEKLKSTATLVSSANYSAAETIVINGVTFTFVATIGATPGNILIGASEAATMANIVALINAPGTTTANGVALSTANQALISGITAATDASHTVTLTGVGTGRLVLSETSATAAWATNYIHAYFGKKGAIDLVVQDVSPVDMRKTVDRRGTNVFSSYLAGVKTFADGAKKFLDVWITGTIGAQPYKGGKKGMDRGIDGYLHFRDADKKPQFAIVSVKGGENINSGMVRDLKGTMEREKAALGLFLTLIKPTREMTKEAASAGIYETGGQKIPRLQILTCEDIIDGKRAIVPFGHVEGFRKAEKEETTQGKLL